MKDLIKELVLQCEELQSTMKHSVKQTDKSHQASQKEKLLLKGLMDKLDVIIKYKKREIVRECGKVQFITHNTGRYSYLDSARMALEGGCQWIQLRMKDAAIDTIRPIAMEIKELCDTHDAVFILDDYVELAKEVQADGVHLGKSDMSIDEARRILGKEFIIGGTANTYEDVEKHWHSGADYIGCGPFRYTETKKNLSPIVGLEGYDKITSMMTNADIDLPIVAIGGITADDIPAILKTGVDGIALSGAVLRAENPVEEMKKIMKQI